MKSQWDNECKMYRTVAPSGCSINDQDEHHRFDITHDKTIRSKDSTSEELQFARAERNSKDT